MAYNPNLYSPYAPQQFQPMQMPQQIQPVYQPMQMYPAPQQQAPEGNTNPEFVTRDYFDARINEVMEAINAKRTFPEQTTSAGQFVAQPNQPDQVAGTVGGAV